MKKIYIAPEMKALEIHQTGILCVSGDITINGFQDDEDILDAN